MTQNSQPGTQELLTFNPLGEDSWVSYKKKYEKKFKKLKVKSVKIIFFLSEPGGEKKYLVSKKRHDKEKSKKDSKWEFPGGKIDKKEKVLSALIRETKEEDESQILSKRLAHIVRLKPSQIRYKLVQLKDGSHHCVFLLPITKTQWSNLNQYYKDHTITNFETYGFELASESFFQLNKTTKTHWTPKTISLLKSLQKSRLVSF